LEIVPVVHRGKVRLFIGKKCIAIQKVLFDSVGITGGAGRWSLPELATPANQYLGTYPFLIGHRYCTFGQKRYAKPASKEAPGYLNGKKFK